ncbi:MAG: hypothetical protein MZU95_11695 [Desulfomicrobium escambiense]|nr:hypothetical protein [Desulfomicrobium escambiense]
MRKGLEVYVPLEGIIDIDKETDRLNKQMGKVNKELAEKLKKLSNPNFVEKAKKEVVEEQLKIKARPGVRTQQVSRRPMRCFKGDETTEANRALSRSS